MSWFTQEERHAVICMLQEMWDEKRASSVWIDDLNDGITKVLSEKDSMVKDDPKEDAPNEDPMSLDATQDEHTPLEQTINDVLKDPLKGTEYAVDATTEGVVDEVEPSRWRA